ncbi:MAG: glycoside hydrolase family 88 protein [Acetatifactor sp.]|nr:glycoside hydrolase family 88 protein [Acetatifactor sp.]
MIHVKEQQWIWETLEKLTGKMEQVAQRSAHKIPYTTVQGVHDDRTGMISWWTNGFWGGMMWQLYQLTGKEFYRSIAEEVEEKLDKNLLDYLGLDHDNGFKWLPTAVADYRFTQNPASKNRGLLAAGNLAGRYNAKGRFIRAWNDWPHEVENKSGWAIIDCMMNLPLLYWASEEIKDPRFAQIASAHAETVAKNFVREDGSVAHIVEFDPENGGKVRSHGGQGYADGSSWTRGQGWGIYGFVLSYLHTKNELFLQTAKKIADYFISNIPDNGLIPVDFHQPGDVKWEDSSAAAIASCGLIELAKLLDEPLQKKYLDAGLKLLKTLSDHRCNWNADEDDILLKCTAAYHDEEHEFSMIYGDYFFLEALLKLTEKERFLW